MAARHSGFRHRLSCFAAAVVAATFACGAIQSAQAQCDPAELAKLVGADADPWDQFGWAVATDGDTILVGAPYDDLADDLDAGSVYVFVRTGEAWTQQAQLVAEDPTGEAYFGYALALDGDTAVIGAFGDEHGVGTLAGSAYVFVRSDRGWTQQAKLVAEDAAEHARFGYSVALRGDAALIGAMTDSLVGWVYSGSAYVFVRCAGVWTQEAKLTAADAAQEDYFGRSVALDDGTALIGAFRGDNGGDLWDDQGSAYVFVHSPDGSWSQQAKLIAEDANSGDYFGYSVALDGDMGVIGAHFADLGDQYNVGAAYVFARQGEVWSQECKLTASDGAAWDIFGCSVAVDGDTALIGAEWDDNAGGIDAGSAYVFARTDGVWSAQAKLIAADAQASGCLGWSMSMANDTVLLGAYGQDSVPGAAYLFDQHARGDMNCDGLVDLADINPFVLYLSNITGWQGAYPACPPVVGDINCDGTYGQWSFGDINPFVALLTGG
jgi:hypothetical protein